MATHPLHEAVGSALGGRVQAAHPVAGGDINQAHEVTLADGRVVFVKSNRSAPLTLFATEARGLAWL
ncbi:MAG TPA: fructosamine kinase family protein, partial [Polyangia bacterium]